MLAKRQAAEKAENAENAESSDKENKEGGGDILGEGEDPDVIF
jgi:hypothetical protein